MVFLHYHKLPKLSVKAHGQVLFHLSGLSILSWQVAALAETMLDLTGETAVAAQVDYSLV
jgi:hypothetical protein